jgi:hypothetical protein
MLHIDVFSDDHYLGAPALSTNARRAKPFAFCEGFFAFQARGEFQPHLRAVAT